MSQGRFFHIEIGINLKFNFSRIFLDYVKDLSEISSEPVIAFHLRKVF